MAYLRTITVLPSGAKSERFVVGGPDGIVNIYEGYRVSSARLAEIFESDDRNYIKSEIGEGLNLKGEELDFVCDQLIAEKENGSLDGILKK